MKERVVITGPTGAVGMALIYKCIQKQTPVLAICHKGSNRNSSLPVSDYLTCIEGDLQNFDKLDCPSGKYTSFYHFAWQGTFGEGRNDVLCQEKNIQYTIKAVELAQRLGCRTFIGAGSQAEYGRTDEVLNAFVKTNPESGYGMAKLCAGQLSRLRCEQLGLKHIWARILSVYGPFDRKETMVQSTLLRMLHNEDVLLTPAEQEWDYLYSEDAAEIFYRLQDSGKHGKIYCLGSGHAQKLKNYVQVMQEISNTKSNVVYGALPYSPAQVMRLKADISEIQKDTGYVPETDFAEGIRRTLKWIKQYYEKNQYSDSLLQ